MSGVRHIEVSEDDDGQRLERWLKKRVPEVPYALAQKLMRKGQVRVDGKRVKPDMRLVTGQKVRIPPIEDRSSKPEIKTKLSSKDAVFIRSLVIYDDGDVIALNKPAGLAVQGGTKTKRHIDGMLDALKNKKDVRPRLVHRLDKDTSGVLLLARSAKVARELGKSFKERGIKKIYWAIVTPAPKIRQGLITAPIIKAGGPDKEKMAVDEKEGKKALTEYRVLDHAGDKAAFIAFWPRTGRTHQIRIHAADVLSCPVLGDGKYGGAASRIEGLDAGRCLHLHAARIICRHPVRKETLDISAPLPPELVKGWKALGFESGYGEDPFADIEA